jgi:maltooligosyltrehalose trehalohydrolase
MSPFGATVLPEGGARFRLWAPAANSVDLLFQGQFIPMERREENFFEKILPTAKAGDLYRYRIDRGQQVPDPASRFQPQDAEGPSEVIDPAAFRWEDDGWKGRPWEEAVVYELHVGSFSQEGSYRGIQKKLPYLAEIGVTAIELMPLSDFAGKRNWGYDGVLPYAPDSAYGRPEDLKALVQAAHRAGLMVFLDVVYNHFGPKGNYLSLYAPQFFTDRYRTPWGAAINFDGPDSKWVREYFIRNAIYWIQEYRLDGLRFDAVHAIMDSSPRHVLLEMASRVRESAPERSVHLILENDANQARFLGRNKYSAQWNDDSHHAYHVLATGENDGYYTAYADAPAKHLARCLAEGFAYQGEVSPFTGEKRGEPSAKLLPIAFVDFLQNHDQIGNRAFGERLSVLAEKDTLKNLAAILLLAPSPPLLFMGEEWGCRQPFLFFCDFDGKLGEAVRNGRREEFKRFAAFRDALARSRIPDPLAESTFRECVLRWDQADPEWAQHYKGLLSIRALEIAHRRPGPGRYRMLAERAFEVRWPMVNDAELRLIANLGAEAVRPGPDKVPGDDERGRLLWTNGEPGAPQTVHWSIVSRFA